MTSKKPAKQAVSNARLVALQKLGLMRDVSAKAELSASQKKKVAAQFKKYHDVANAPKGTYKAQDVSGFFPGQIKAIEKSGITVINGKAYVRQQGYESVKIVKKKYKTGPGMHSTIIGVDYKTDKRKSAFHIIGTPVEIADWRERAARDYYAGNLKDGQFVAWQAYDNSPMARSNTISLDSLFKYESQIKYHGNPDDVRDHMRLVIITVKELKDFDANSKTRRQQNAARYQRKKNEMKTGTRKLTGRIKRK
jgi:hypothetical protein